ncbi:transcriptional regulator [Acidihalobacter yilgarnensis]|uniref:Transcriptional regulator n=1 Tax=Acidihalobacter yilgarnensis TaxID=2819280 RepID=A0A1D8IKW6_9GAMM|nr:NadS family protein [Acidihalobacter yilgarnensis]AOU97065.1 transcriptional regulator [Acidihalobacter yilgarnensis]
MDKALFDELTESLKEAGNICYGGQASPRRFAFDALDVKAIRERTGLSQGRFALLMGVSVRTLQNWEQGRRQPQGPAESLLRIVKNDPQGAMNALHG